MASWHVLKGLRSWMKTLFLKKYFYHHRMEPGRRDWCRMLSKRNSTELGSGYAIKVNLRHWVTLVSTSNFVNRFTQFSVFISYVIKTKHRNHSINKDENLGYDRYGDCYINNLAKNQASAVFHSRVIRRSVSPKFIELCVPFGGVQTRRP